MNRFFTLLLAASCWTAVGQECANDFYPPIFTGELAIPEGIAEDSYEIADVTLTYATVNLYLMSETINYLDLENPELFMPIHEDNCTDSLDLNWQQFPLTGGCTGTVYRRYFFSDSNGNQTDFFDVYIQLLDDESPYIIQGPSDLTLDCSNSLYYQEALDWFESGGGIVAGDSVATFLEGSVWEPNPLNIVAEYDVIAIIAGEPATIEVSWRVLDQCDNESIATSLLILECGINAEGCTDEMACNFNPNATEDDSSCLYLDDCMVCGGDNSSCFGCLDSQACNYNNTAGIVSDPSSCDYSCCPGPGCCGTGTTWNWQTSECDVANPADINLDGCVQLGDLLDLLGAYGDCGAEESAWQCGDPLEYQGYEYATVQIGEQCWFAENLRAEKYATGDPIPSSLNQLQWSIATAGASDNYGLRQGVQCQDYADDPDYDIQTCNPEEALLEYGLLYNAFAMIDSRGLCPTGWIVPADEEWNELEIFLGMDPALAFQIGDRGTAHGAQLRSSYGWRSGANGSDDFGFSVVAGGRTSNGGDYDDAGRNGQFWSTSQRESGEPYWYIRDFQYGVGSVKRYDTSAESGLSIRCIKDAE